MKHFFNRVWLCMQLPKKQVVFRLNRERIGVPFLYVGLLIAFVCIPLFVQTFIQSDGVIADLILPMFAVYFLFIYFPIFALSVFSLIAAVAAIALTVAKLADRKLTYLMLYKIAAFAATIPIIGYGVSLLISEEFAMIWIWASFLYLVAVLIRVIFHYPKARKK
ncbi:hypothetical protein [Shouchella patagoniensis]|uniref:hypothetical protein n=1 Tax=Shouchella patagoniensis TaxID=228576 RepID=UPI0009953AF2|nr:hypothetical protein [Shouchella patagoniensis]